MSQILLDARLELVKSFVPRDSVVADIGCDHGYLICALAKSQLIKRGFACEANIEPFKRAQKTVMENCLSDKVEVVLTNGLTDLPHSDIDVFVIAGMGGELISEIILSHAFTRNSHYDFILQPMTKPERLRQSLLENGFNIAKEQTVITDDKVYTVMLINYTQSTLPLAQLTFQTGLLLSHDDIPTRRYMKKLISQLEKKVIGAKLEDNGKLVDELEDVIATIRERISLDGM